jgi:hypothetical protein
MVDENTTTREFSPEGGYAFLNRWTRHVESYETRFAGKEVTEVCVQMSDGKPVSASVHYRNDGSIGVETINLNGRLRESPISEHDFDFMQKLAQTRKA